VSSDLARRELSELKPQHEPGLAPPLKSELTRIAIVYAVVAFLGVWLLTLPCRLLRRRAC
jgi:hypothetical protein